MSKLCSKINIKSLFHLQLQMKIQCTFSFMLIERKQSLLHSLTPHVLQIATHVLHTARDGQSTRSGSERLHVHVNSIHSGHDARNTSERSHSSQSGRRLLRLSATCSHPGAGRRGVTTVLVL